MDKTTALLIGLGILALLAIAFFAVFRGKGKLNVKSPLGSLKAEGENPPPPATVPGGVKIKDAEAGRNIRAQSQGAGGVDLEKVKAKGDITATSSSTDQPSPKT
jgi:hypothetical protein